MGPTHPPAALLATPSKYVRRSNASVTPSQDFPPPLPRTIRKQQHRLQQNTMSSQPTTYLITGTSRGTGLALTAQILCTNPFAKVIATARHPEASIGLQELIKTYGSERIVCVTLDVADLTSVEMAAGIVNKLGFVTNGLDVLINAGCFAGGLDSPVNSDPDLVDLQHSIDVNLYGVAAVTQAFLPLLRVGRNKQIFTMTALGGSFGGPMSKWSAGVAFCVSKAAANMYLLKLSLDLHADKFTVVAFHPGFVESGFHPEIGGLITPQESAKVMLATMNRCTTADNGTFKNHDGEAIPW